ncbi:hypothetical protein GMSM_14680 [Geomonas sp. Red276]
MEDRLNRLSALTAAQLMAIGRPERLFSPDEEALKREYRHLAFA